MVDLYERRATALVEAALADTPVVTVQGARQTGKSTLVGALAAERGALVVTLDDPAALEAARVDPEAFVAAGGDGLMVVDEVQRAPELILPIKASVDRDRRPGRFLLTGSADLMRVPGAGDSLAGRAETIPLYPLSQGELAGRRDDFVSAVLSADLHGWQTQWARADYVAAICAGGYPPARLRSDPRRAAWLDDYTGRLLRRDARDITTADPTRLRRVLELVAAAQAGELVTARLARDLGVAEGTARADVQRLTDLYLVDLVPAWSRSLTQRRVRKPKALVVDSGLATMLDDLGEEDLASPLGVNHLGGLLEGFVAAELMRQRTWSTTRHRLSHYRESGGTEVDLIIDLPGGRAIGIEVKATTSAKSEHARGLRALRERLGSDFVAGIVFHLGQQAWRFGDGIWALPVAALWEL